ncbi:peptidase M20 [Pseudoxanthomonas kalamensis DSM 18571]|uniref:M20/M25/M40 family metallo-hydrolase n=1 Tax=Pseudoxanthomonas kalamensis TaxID=289483 RepID=UPI0013918AB8|nr:M20/M25/M40 family metallo-hydrolase [Pseudoxanthomonas kalamensis]KAF1710420.1 peptidase M20 [Pseudoxanthomonas kalamensis DSM 18571]
MRFRLSIPLLGLLAVASPAFAALSPQEKVMVDTVEAEYERSVSLLETLVNQNSGSLNLAGVKAVADLLRPEFEQLGFEVEWKPMMHTQRAGHLIATHAGTPGGKRLLLIGHLDTVFEPDSPFQTFVRDGQYATGPGVEDDKGGVTIMLAALRAMHAAGTLQNTNVDVVLTGDEEDAGDPQDQARADLVAAGRRADAALDFEGLSVQNGQDMGSIARRSSNVWTLTATGRSGHSSGIFSKGAGDGAVFELARIIAAFREQLPEPNLTFNVGLLGGGQGVEVDDDGVRMTVAGKTNIIPPLAIAMGDFRTLSQEQTERVKAKMRQIVAAHLPQTEAEIVFDDPYPPMAPTEGNRALLGRLNEVNADLGLAPMPELDPLKRGAGDIAFVAADVDGLIGLGMSGTGGHSPRETADLDSIRRQAKRAAILMSRLGAESKP